MDRLAIDRQRVNADHLPPRLWPLLVVGRTVAAATVLVLEVVEADAAVPGGARAGGARLGLGPN